MGTSIRHLNTYEHINYSCKYGRRYEQHIANQNTLVHFFHRSGTTLKHVKSQKYGVKIDDIFFVIVAKMCK